MTSNATIIVSLFIFFVSLILLMKSQLSFIYEGNDLECGWKKWSENFEILLKWHSIELIIGQVFFVCYVRNFGPNMELGCFYFIYVEFTSFSVVLCIKKIVWCLLASEQSRIIQNMSQWKTTSSSFSKTRSFMSLIHNDQLKSHQLKTVTLQF